MEVSRYSPQPHYTGKLIGPAGIPHIDEINILAVALVHGCPQGSFFKLFTAMLYSVNGYLINGSKKSVLSLLVQRYSTSS